MGLFDRWRRGGRRGETRSASATDAEHLRNWAARRTGVEAYLEPRTNVTETTVMLIAGDGEWTRRRIDGADAAYRLAKKLGVPCYEVTKVGYPNRMREHQARQRALRERARRKALED